jgi:hypothetical protein
MEFSRLTKLKMLELHYDGRFTAIQFLATSTSRLTISNFFSNLTLTVIVLMLHLLSQEDGFVVYNCCWPSPAQLFSGPSPASLMTTFYCLRFETPPPCSWTLFPQEQGGRIIPPGTGFPFHRFLRLSGVSEPPSTRGTTD